jgi:hypothetical protein
MAEWLEVCGAFDGFTPAVSVRSQALREGNPLPPLMSQDLLAVVGEMVLACAEGS